MVKKTKCIIAILILIILLFTSSVSLAAWWGAPGYEWGLSRGLTSVKTSTQLNQTVKHSDFYSIILKYLELKEIRPENNIVHHNDDMYGINNVVAGLFKLINTYTSKKSLTPNEYRQVESYVQHSRDTFQKYSQYLNKNSIKNIELYLKLSQYRAATLIDDRDFRELTLSRLGRVKNSEIFAYGIIPYAGDVTRKEFLLLMFDLLSSQNMSEEAIIDSFNEAGVLLGYESDLMLDREITYSEMLTFLYRFEIYDFNPAPEEAEDVEEDETIRK